MDAVDPWKAASSRAHRRALRDGVAVTAISLSHVPLLTSTRCNALKKHFALRWWHGPRALAAATDGRSCAPSARTASALTFQAVEAALLAEREMIRMKVRRQLEEALNEAQLVERILTQRIAIDNVNAEARKASAQRSS